MTDHPQYIEVWGVCVHFGQIIFNPAAEHLTLCPISYLKYCFYYFYYFKDHNHIIFNK